MSWISHNKKRGLAILYAVLLVSIVLTVSLSLLNITFKQLILTAISRESQAAHFTALSVLDCVIFTDKVAHSNSSGDNLPDNPFGVFTFDPALDLNKPINPPNPFFCGSGAETITGTVTSAAADRALIPGTPAIGIISRYSFTGPGLSGRQAVAEVVKVYSGDYGLGKFGDNLDDQGKVFITSFGRNTDLSSPRLVERIARKFY